MSLIYRITNEKTGKVYIGQTSQSLARRKGEHVYRFKLGERDHKLYRSMRKHGVEQFRFESICCAVKPEYLDELEVHFIREHNSFNRGYNMTVGGDSVSEETKKKLSAIFKGRKIHWMHKIVAARKANGTGGVHKALWFKVRNREGNVEIHKNMSAFCRARGMDVSNLRKTLVGTVDHTGTPRLPSHCKGYTLLETFNDYPEREYA